MNDGTNLQVEVSQPLAEARVFKIVTTEQYSAAGEKLKGIMALKRKVDAAFDDIIKKAYSTHREAVAKKKEHEAPLIEAEGIYKRAMLGFQQDQERIRREQQAKLEEEARKEREKLEARAAKAEEKGKTEKADELRAQAATVPTPIVQIETPRVASISTRETHRAVVVDQMALLKAVVEGKVPEGAILANDAFLNAQARLQKSALNYPGVKVVVEQGIASRSA